MVVPSVDKNAKLKIEDVEFSDEIPVEEKRGIFTFVVGTIFGLLFFGVVAVLGYIYFNPTPVKETPKVEDVSPTPTITEVIKKVEVVFEVLNSTGTAGLGLKTKQKIEALGYKVDLVGNGTGKHTGVELYLAATVVDQKDDLINKLKVSFPKVNYFGELKDSTVSARLIIGK